MSSCSVVVGRAATSTCRCDASSSRAFLFGGGTRRGTKTTQKNVAMMLSRSAPLTVSRRRLLSSVTVTKTTSRLESLREQLSNDDDSLHDFAFERPLRKKAPPRSDKILPKPRWLKAKPADSENYQTLRNTVRELGLATVCEGRFH